MMPQFADGDPQTTNVDGGDRINPQNEPGWFDAEVKDPVVAFIKSIPALRARKCAADDVHGLAETNSGQNAPTTCTTNGETATNSICADGTWIPAPCTAAATNCGTSVPGTPRQFNPADVTQIKTSDQICGRNGNWYGGTSAAAKFSNDEATAIFNELYNNNLIFHFSSHGDSGSWVMRGDTTVLGLLWGGDYYMPAKGTKRVIQGMDWYAIRTKDNIYDIDTVTLFANNHLKKLNMAVCTTSNRPAPPQACQWSARQARCIFPTYCRKNGDTTCTLRTDIG